MGLTLPLVKMIMKKKKVYFYKCVTSLYVCHLKECSPPPAVPQNLMSKSSFNLSYCSDPLTENS